MLRDLAIANPFRANPSHGMSRRKRRNIGLKPYVQSLDPRTLLSFAVSLNATAYVRDDNSYSYLSYNSISGNPSSASTSFNELGFSGSATTSGSFFTTDSSLYSEASGNGTANGSAQAPPNLFQSSGFTLISGTLTLMESSVVTVYSAIHTIIPDLGIDRMEPQIGVAPILGLGGFGGPTSEVLSSGVYQVSNFEVGNSAFYENGSDLDSYASQDAYIEIDVSPATAVASNSSLTSTPNPSASGQPVTFTTTVSPTTSGQPTPTGIVTFLDESTVLGTGTLNTSGTATFTTTSSQLLSVGIHSITAVYGGDSNFSSSTSPTIDQQVSQGSTTTTVVDSSFNPSVYGQDVTFTASVTANKSAAARHRHRHLHGRANSLGTGTLDSSGRRHDHDRHLGGRRPLGNHCCLRRRRRFNGSTSPAIDQQVSQGSTTTTVDSSLNPSVYGQDVTFTASVTSPYLTYPHRPTGSVVFVIDGTSYGPIGLSGGTASIEDAWLGVNGSPHTVTASYTDGAGNFVSRSGMLSGGQTVNADTTTTSLVSSASTSVRFQPVTFTALVTADYPGGGTPTGTVTFMDGATTLGTSTLDGTGTAALTIDNLPVGDHTAITAIYSGDPNFSGGTSPAIDQVVNLDNTTIVLTSSPDPSTYGQSITFTVTVQPVPPGYVGPPPPPTGTVTIFDPISPLVTYVLGPFALPNNGKLTIKTKILPASLNAEEITAVYSGDATYAMNSVTINQIISRDFTTTSVTSTANPSVAGQAVVHGQGDGE